MNSRPTCGCKIEISTSGAFAHIVAEAEKLYTHTNAKGDRITSWRHASPEQRAPYVAAVIDLHRRRNDTTRTADAAPKMPHGAWIPIVLTGLAAGIVCGLSALAILTIA